MLQRAEKLARQRETQRKWRRNNPDKVKAATIKWRTKNKPAYLQKQAEWRRANPELAKAAGRRKRLRKYGLTEETWAALFEMQGRKCAMPGCDAVEAGGRGDWHVDHCHHTGVVRGITCSRCNHMLGHARDNVAILRGAIEYLERSRAQ